MFDFSIGRNKSLENAASKVLNEALSLNRMPAARSPITQRSVFAPQGSTEDALMNWRPGQRPLGGMEVPGGPIGGDQDAFERTMQGMGYSSSIDPETGKTVYSGGSKPSLTLGTRGKMLRDVASGKVAAPAGDEELRSLELNTQAQRNRQQRLAAKEQGVSPLAGQGVTTKPDQVLSQNEAGNIRREILGGKERSTYAYYKGQAPSKGMEYRYTEKDELGRNRDIYTMGGTNPRL